MRNLIMSLSLITLSQAIVTVKPVDVLENANGISAKVSVAFSINQGNTELSASDFGGLIQFDANKSVAFVKGNYKRGDAKSVLTIDQGFIHGRFIYNIDTLFDTEFFLQQQFNAFLKIRSRSLAGTGARLNIGEATNYGKGYLGVGAFYDIEQDVGSALQQFVRANVYLSYKFSYNKTVNFALVSYYQPNVNALNDFLLLSIAELEVKINERLSLMLNGTFNYDSKPVLGVKPYDFSQTTALAFSF